MPNLDQPCGAVPHERVIRARKYVAGSRVFPGDFVALASDGKVDAGAAGANALIGVALTYADADLAEVIVADHPNQIFKVQADAADVDAQTDIGLNYAILATAGSTTYKISRHELDAETGRSDSNYQLKLLDIDSRPDNALGAAVDCLVVINNHALAGGTGTLGV